mmetsp:Transcript_33113/g.59447  ORF Transcript_33113/g.59447 Transcript_33113/m.59447 type:complete len:220 (-) Transcript_33113:421-1080(-)
MRQARRNGQNGPQATAKCAIDQHLPSASIHRHVRQVETQRCQGQLCCLAQGSNGLQATHSGGHSFASWRLRGSLQELRGVVPQLQESQLQHQLLQGRAPHLAEAVLGQPALKGLLVESPAHPWAGTSSSASALLAGGLADPNRGEDTHRGPRIKPHLFQMPRVDDVRCIIYGDGRFSDIRCNHNLPFSVGGTLEDLPLLMHRHRTEQRQEPRTITYTRM